MPSRKMELYLDPVVGQRLKIYAVARGVTMGQLAGSILDKWLDSQPLVGSPNVSEKSFPSKACLKK